MAIVDSATATASALKKILGAASHLPNSQPSLDVVLTDTPVQFLELANAHLGLQISPGSVTLVSPDKLHS